MITTTYHEGDYGTEARRNKVRDEGSARKQTGQRAPRRSSQVWTDTLKERRQEFLNKWKRF